MNLLVALMLTAGLNSPIPADLPASPAPRAEATLNRLVAAAEPTLQRQAVNEALADGTRRMGKALSVQLATTHSLPTSPRLQAKAALDRMVADASAGLARQAVNEALADCTRQLGQSLAAQMVAIRTQVNADERLAAQQAPASPDLRQGASKLPIAK